MPRPPLHMWDGDGRRRGGGVPAPRAVVRLDPVITTNVLGVVLASLAAGYWAGAPSLTRAARGGLYLVSGAGARARCASVGRRPGPRRRSPRARPAGRVAILGNARRHGRALRGPVRIVGNGVAVRDPPPGARRRAGREPRRPRLRAVDPREPRGAYLPSLVTIPWIGTRATILLFGALVLASAAAGFAAERKKIAAVGALCVTALAGAAAAFPPRPARAAGILEERESEYHLSRVIRHESKKCNVLEINEGLVPLDPVRRRARAAGLLGALQPLPLLVPRADPLRVCILGLAAGTVASQSPTILRRGARPPGRRRRDRRRARGARAQVFRPRGVAPRDLPRGRAHLPRAPRRALFVGDRRRLSPTLPFRRTSPRASSSSSCASGSSPAGSSRSTWGDHGGLPVLLGIRTRSPPRSAPCFDRALRGP